MRRPAFSVLLLLIIVVVLLDYFSVPLIGLYFNKSQMSYDMLNSLTGESSQYEGKIIGIKVKDDSVKFEVETDDFRILLTMYEQLEPEDYKSLYSKRISFKTQLKIAEVSRNPNCFNYRRYLLSQGISFVGTISSFNEIYYELSIIDKYKNYLFEKKIQFKELLLDNSKGMVMGIIFGDTSSLDDAVYEEFRSNGTAHILAVSGLHVGLIYSILEKLLKNKNGAIKLSIITFFMLTFGFLSMWSISTIRALSMIALKITAEKLDLRYDMLNSLGIVGIVLIICNPYVIYSSSFQMSFLAIMSIGLIMPYLKGKIPENILISLSVYIGLLIYQIWNFNYISLTAVFANIPVIYLVTIIAPVYLSSFLLFLLNGNRIVGNEIIEAMSNTLIKVNSLSTLEGKGNIKIASFSIIFTVLLIMTTFFLCSEFLLILKKKDNKACICGACLTITIISISFHLMFCSPISNDDIIFVDVGQGDCCHINYKNKDIIIDGGGSYSYNVGENTVMQYLLKNGNNDVDLAIATHEHMDHFKGLSELYEAFKVKQMLTKLIKGNTLYISDELRIETLWPTSINEIKGQDLNSDCSVFMIYYKGYKILVTGDLDATGEKSLLALYSREQLKADILKVGHHGSKTSTSLEFLKVVDPIYAVISVGKNNYGHPAPETIENLTKSGIIICSTLDCGAVGFRLKKDKLICHKMIS